MENLALNHVVKLPGIRLPRVHIDIQCRVELLYELWVVSIREGKHAMGLKLIDDLRIF